MGWMSEEEAQARWEAQMEAEQDGARLELEGCAAEAQAEAERKTAEEIETDLTILEIQFWYGDSMSRAEYERKKRELERRLEKEGE